MYLLTALELALGAFGVLVFTILNVCDAVLEVMPVAPADFADEFVRVPVELPAAVAVCVAMLPKDVVVNVLVPDADVTACVCVVCFVV